MTHLRITEEQRAWGLAQFPELMKLIDQGKWEYSASKLKQEYSSYSMFTWTEVHPYLYILICLFLMPMGLIPAICYIAAVMMMKPAREQYEVHLIKLKNGKPFETAERETPTRRTQEIAQLHELLKCGALTEQEFQEQKRKILAKAA